jgi:hypothetical protein
MSANVKTPAYLDRAVQRAVKAPAGASAASGGRPGLFEPWSPWSSVAGRAGAEASREAASALGLSRLQSVTRYRGGSRLTLPKEGKCGRGGRRGARRSCHGMTKFAKRTAERIFNEVDRSRVLATFFGGMTLPADENVSPQEFKKILQRYFAAFFRRWADRAFIYWAMEPTELGTWHVHPIICWVKQVPSLRDFREWNDVTWARSTRCKHPDHQRVACNITRARHWGGVRSYLATYLKVSKWKAWVESHPGVDTGRVHGLRGAHLVPRSPESIVLSPEGLAILRRAVGRFLSKKSGGTWTEDIDTGNRTRIKLPVHPQRRRELIKSIAEVSQRNGFKLLRRRRRFFRNMTEWDEERDVLPDGREVNPRLVPHCVDDWGRPVPHGFGPSCLQGVRYPDELRRLVEWADRESLRRAEEREGLPF